MLSCFRVVLLCLVLLVVRANGRGVLGGLPHGYVRHMHEVIDNAFADELSVKVREGDINSVALSSCTIGTEALASIVSAVINLHPIRSSSSSSSSSNRNDSTSISRVTRLSIQHCHLDANALSLALSYYRALAESESSSSISSSSSSNSSEITQSALPPPLKELDVSFNSCLDTRGIKLLSTIVRQAECLESLVLDGNPLSPEAVRYLAHALRRHPSIRRLSLSSCGLQDESAEYLAFVLKSNKNITGLDISRNAISPKGLEAIAAAFRSGACRALRCLNLAHNPLEGMGAITIARALDANLLPSLEHLSLRSTQAGPVELEHLLTAIAVAAEAETAAAASATTSAAAATPAAAAVPRLGSIKENVSVVTGSSSSSSSSSGCRLVTLDLSGNVLVAPETSPGGKAKGTKRRVEQLAAKFFGAGAGGALSLEAAASTASSAMSSGLQLFRELGESVEAAVAGGRGGSTRKAKRRLMIKSKSQSKSIKWRLPPQLKKKSKKKPKQLKEADAARHSLKVAARRLLKSRRRSLSALARAVIALEALGENTDAVAVTVAAATPAAAAAAAQSTTNARTQQRRRRLELLGLADVGLGGACVELLVDICKAKTRAGSETGSASGSGSGSSTTAAPVEGLADTDNAPSGLIVALELNPLSAEGAAAIRAALSRASKRGRPIPQQQQQQQ